jgi:hypothetical protein
MTALQNDPLPNPPTGWSTNNWYWSATSTADNSHNYHYFINGTSGPNADMNAYFTAFQVL